MTKYAVISNDPKAFFLGRYQTLEAAQKAIGGRADIWCLYEMVNQDKQISYHVDVSNPNKK